jgi:multidrug efflux pump subunit AcrA (membrane-fusion protein)
MNTRLFFKKILAVFLVATVLFACDKKETTTPAIKTIVDAVFASGYVNFNNEYWVTANAEGFILKSYIKEGDEVKKSQQLFQLSNEVQSLQSNNAQLNYQDALDKFAPHAPQVLQLKNQITLAKKTLKLDEKNYHRYAQLVKTHAVSQLDFEKAQLQYESAISNLEILKKSLADLNTNLRLQVKNTRNQLNIQAQYFGDFLLSSSLNGIVLEIAKNTGELANKGALLARIGGGQLITKLYIAEEDINKIKLNQLVVLALNTETEKNYQATVSKIYPAFNDTEQSFVIEVDFKENIPMLRSGTQVQANIVIEERKNALVIPTHFLLKNNKVCLKNGEEISVTTGVKNSQWVEVLTGLDMDTQLTAPN